MSRKQLTFIDLFCGIGGFHQAMSSLGAKCVFACDIDADCRKTYELNYGNQNTLFIQSSHSLRQ